MCTFRQVVNVERLAIVVFDDDLRVHVTFEVDDRTANGTTRIFLRLHRDAFDDVLKANLSTDFGEYRNRVRVPVAKH